jgi:hypothetical protein
MTQESLTLYSSWIGTAIAVGAAAYERFRSSRSADKAITATERAHEAEASQKAHQEILAQKDELIRLARDSAVQWKEKCQAEHAEFSAYREKHHLLMQESQATMLNQAEEIASLKAKTDLVPVMQLLQEVVGGLKLLIERVETQTEKKKAP